MNALQVCSGMSNDVFHVLEGKSSILSQWLASALKEQDGTVLDVQTCLNAKTEKNGMSLVFSASVRTKLSGTGIIVKRKLGVLEDSTEI